MKAHYNQISDEQLLEELRRRFKQNKESLEEVQLLAEELKIANKKLRESESLKTHFISNVTNELVNPFTSIVLLSRNIMNVTDLEKAKPMAKLILEEASVLDLQFKNIFASAEFESGECHVEISKVDIQELIKSVIQNFEILAEKKAVTVEIIDLLPHPEFFFNTDARKLALIVSNLIDNAIKFNLENGKVNVKLELENEKLKITVTDTGTGISDDNKKIIFDRFRRINEQIDSINRGHGLGLSINKAVIDFLEGDIKLDSKVGEGSTFTIYLPQLNEQQNEDFFSGSGNEVFF